MGVNVKLNFLCQLDIKGDKCTNRWEPAARVTATCQALWQLMSKATGGKIKELLQEKEASAEKEEAIMKERRQTTQVLEKGEGQGLVKVAKK